MNLHKTMFRKGLIAAAMLLPSIVLAAPAAGQRAERVIVRGQLLDRADGHPLTAARVAIPTRNVAVYTDSSGGFVLPPMPAGTYDVEMERLGYHAIRANLTLEKDDSVVVRLAPEPLALEELKVFGNSLLTRTERSTVSARSFDARMFDTYSGGNTLAFLGDYAGIHAMPCTATAPGSNCATIRGLPESVGVWIDGQPSMFGLEELRTIPAQEIFHINVYMGGALVEVITREYAREEAHHRIKHPLPPFITMRAVQLQGRIQSQQ
ncbi:carboxypeptidase regulatory-like domain-containing protein [Longimicrobium sp.]|uniref:carboxypeptidase regulatory-like domain-containing protein n=1 Tax=Longimicrobium sp. TaxID=2029185 RepID=UPI002D0F715F|nr:carboxypeptidase regulatory-like domain-containing protein [Longimicrobium sp.]HSU15983.1 carboxypeptidase regulatory-like domain-containing protein [Longimicrobium sp.]